VTTEPAGTERRRLAAFDVDGTLTTHDCVVPFLRLVAGTRSIGADLLRQAGQSVTAVMRRDRDALKALAARSAFRGRPVPEVGRHAAAFARMVHDTRLRTDTVAMLRQHQEAGDIVVLVSASFEVYIRPLGGLLGVDDVLAARLVVGDDRCFTGELNGPNCRGPEKVQRLHAWLDEHHGDVGGRSGVHVTAYGDSTGDRELLLDADEAVFVGKRHPSWLPAPTP
jgi:phosphatidylglycerophosphatase C